MQTNRQQSSSTPRKGLFVIRTAAKDRCGFTIIELMIVVTIISILSITAFANFSKFKQNAKIYRCMGEIRGLEREIAAYTTERGSYPSGLVDIGRENMLDPWGNNYIYSVPTRTHVGLPINKDFDLFSKGINGTTAVSINDSVSDDDVIRGRDGSYAGLAIKY